MACRSQDTLDHRSRRIGRAPGKPHSIGSTHQKPEPENNLYLNFFSLSTRPDYSQLIAKPWLAKQCYRARRVLLNRAQVEQWVLLRRPRLVRLMRLIAVSTVSAAHTQPRSQTLAARAPSRVAPARMTHHTQLQIAHAPRHDAPKGQSTHIGQPQPGHDQPPGEAAPTTPASPRDRTPPIAGHPSPCRGAQPTPSHALLTAARKAVNFRSICFDAFQTAP